VAVTIVRNRTLAEIRALRLALNRIVEEAKWDQGKLRTELFELLELGFDLELTGFDAIEIDMTLNIEQPTTGIVEEALAEDLEPASEAKVVARGDVWLLRDHVIACGDSQDAELLRRLMGERKAAVVFTDPPYNVKIRGFVSGLGKTTHREFAMASGEMSEEEFKSFLVRFLAALLPLLVNGAILFVCMDWRHLREILDAGDHADLELKNLCVWAKSNAGMGTFYRSQHDSFSCSSTAMRRIKTTSNSANAAAHARTFGLTGASIPSARTAWSFWAPIRRLNRSRSLPTRFGMYPGAARSSSTPF
jgi:hypothetical protein